MSRSAVVATISATLLLVSLCLQPGLSAASPAPAATAAVLNGRIVFQMQPSDGSVPVQLFTIKQDGSDLTQLTTVGSNEGPTWSPSGTTIASVNHANSPNTYCCPTLQLMGARGDGIHTVGPADCWGGYLDHLAWSPDGTKLLFDSICGSPAHPTLWTVDADGSNLTELREFPQATAIASPSWSPDGNTIVFALDLSTTHANAFYQIYSINVNGTGKARLTATKNGAYTPQFSPDGRRIVFEQEIHGRNGIYTMNPDGSDPGLVVTFGKYAILTPSWSPDGRWIVFSSTVPQCDGCTKAFSANLYVVRADGSGITSLTSFQPGLAALSPSWQPRIRAGT